MVYQFGSKRLKRQDQQREDQAGDEGCTRNGKGIALALHEPGYQSRCRDTNNQQSDCKEDRDAQWNADRRQQKQHHGKAERGSRGTEKAVEGQVHSPPRAVRCFCDWDRGQHLPALGGKRAHAPTQERKKPASERGDKHEVHHGSSSTGVASSERTATSVSVRGVPSITEKRLCTPPRRWFSIKSLAKRMRLGWKSRTTVLLPGRNSALGEPARRNMPFSTGRGFS